MKITLSAYAKINLFLDVTGKLENGYHEILSLMQSVDLCDEISVETTSDLNGEITVECDHPKIPTDEKNLAFRAAKRFYLAFGEGYRTHIAIRKRIPMEAGLAGGSTDAAAVLIALNRIYGTPFSKERLCEIGAKIGADVPFCICGGTVEARGIGEILQRKPNLPKMPILIAKTGAGVSTPEAYRTLDEKYGQFAERRGTAQEGTYQALLSAIASADITQICANLYNIFEPVVFSQHPEARNLHRFLLENGALGARMSGSGPSVFAIFPSAEEAERAAELLRVGGIAASAFVTYPIS